MHQRVEVAGAGQPREQQAEMWTGARLGGPGRSGQAALGAQPRELLGNHVHTSWLLYLVTSAVSLTFLGPSTPWQPPQISR